jgi:peptidyl-prolyl cis-trans isomerase C
MVENRALKLLVLFAVIGLIAMQGHAGAEGSLPRAGSRAATVNGAPIDRGEFDQAVLKIQRTLLEFGKPLTVNQVTAVQTDVLEGLIRREILYQESRKAGIRPDEKAVSEEIKALKGQFSREAEYKDELSRRNMTEETLRSRLERNSAVEQYIESRFASKVEVTDKEMLAYYESRLDLFKQPLQVRASHILIHMDSQWEAPRKQDARRKAEQIQQSLKKDGDFAILAREHSDGPTRTNGGDIGYIRAGQIEKQLETVIFSMKPGETSEIIETAYGFHLFKVTDRKPETILAYDSIKEELRRSLRIEKARQEADLFAKSLREKAVVEILLNDEISSVKQL